MSPLPYFLVRHIAAGRDARGEAPPPFTALLVGIGSVAMLSLAGLVLFVLGIAIAGAFGII